MRQRRYLVTTTNTKYLPSEVVEDINSGRALLVFLKDKKLFRRLAKYYKETERRNHTDAKTYNGVTNRLSDTIVRFD